MSNDHEKQVNAKRQRRWANKKKASGLCLTCGKRSPKYTRCRVCREIFNAQARERYRQKTISSK